MRVCVCVDVYRAHHIPRNALANMRLYTNFVRLSIEFAMANELFRIEQIKYDNYRYIHI